MVVLADEGVVCFRCSSRGGSARTVRKEYLYFCTVAVRKGRSCDMTNRGGSFRRSLPTDGVKEGASVLLCNTFLLSRCI